MLLMDKVIAGARRLLASWDEPLDETDPYYLFASFEKPLGDAGLGRRYRDRETKRLLADLGDAARFRVDRTTVMYLKPLLDAPDRITAASAHIFLPAPNTWIEMDDGEQRCGFLLRSEDCAFQSMSLDMFEPAASGGYGGSFYPPDRTIYWAPSANDSAANHDPVARRPSVVPDKFDKALVLATVLALLSTPRLFSARKIDHAKINRQRTARGKWPLLAYQEVTINLLDPRVETEAFHQGGNGSARALHFVRAHLRIRSNGRLEWVRPHWRGDAQLGIRRPAYRLTA